jgi:hypothetical protein
MGVQQAVLLAVGALLVTLGDHHVIFAIMTTFTGTSVVYLLISLRGQLFGPDSPSTTPHLEPRPLIDRCMPLREVGVLPVS